MDGLGREAWDNGREPRGGVKSPGVEAGKGGLGNSRGTFLSLRCLWCSLLYGITGASGTALSPW